MPNNKIVSAVHIDQGDFKVDASGQATYAISIEVPPGISKLHPKLKISYNHRKPNGKLGVGWSLSGNSCISRSRATKVQDGFRGSINFDQHDRFTLDGKRLVNISGNYGEADSIYYTEINYWDKVISGSTPEDGFIVHKKNGNIWKYGTTPDSCIRTSDNKFVRAWALCEIRDLNGNRIEYNYSQTPAGSEASSGAFYLSAIKYTVRDNLAPAYFINFSYAKRNDPITNYVGGYKVNIEYLLQKIETVIKTPAGIQEVIRSYDLSYQTSAATHRSFLNTINISGAASEGSPALKPYTFNWQDIPVSNLNTDHPQSELLLQSDLIKTLTLDTNGDGKSDIIQFWNDSEFLNATPFIASEDVNGKVNFIQKDDISLGNYELDKIDQYIYSGDFNGNGINDLLIVYPDENNLLAMDVFFANGSGYDAAVTHATNNPWMDEDAIGFFPMDITGDGRIDLMQAYTDENENLVFDSYFSNFKGNTGSFSEVQTTATQYPYAEGNRLWPMDVNGNKMTDMVFTWRDQNGLIKITSFLPLDQSGISPFQVAKDSELNIVDNDQIAFLPADVNGDGVMDLIQVYNSDNQTKLNIQSFFSDGTGQFVNGPLSSFDNMRIDANQCIPVGLNGCGQTDMFTYWLDENDDNRLNFLLFTSTPSGKFIKTATIKTNENLPNTNFYVGDVNGNGKGDLIYLSANQDDRVVAHPFTSAGFYPDLMNSLTDQLGGKVSIRYKPISDSQVYSSSQQNYPQTNGLRYINHLSPSQFPVQTVLAKAIYVVAEYALHNDKEKNRFLYSHAFQLKYSNARINLAGRGWEGFQTMSTWDKGTGAVTTTTFNQDFPYTGKVAKTEVKSKGQLLKTTVTTYSNRNPSGVTANVYELLTTGTLIYHFESGDWDYCNGKTFEYDEYGNCTLQVWQGYVQYIDPTTINSSANPIVADLLNSLTPSEKVFHYKKFKNDQLPNQSWALGYLEYEKKSTNASDADITKFLTGDLQLAKISHTPSTYNVAEKSHWDNHNNCFITTAYEYDEYGNHIAEIHPGGFKTIYEYDQEYHCFLYKSTSPQNVQGLALTTLHAFDPRFGKEVAHQDENGFVHIIALDGFGRKKAKQGPVPDGIQNDVNQLTKFASGTFDFKAAQVLTIDTYDYGDDGSGGIYIKHGSLEEFPNGTERTFFYKQKYVDGLDREGQLVLLTGQSAGSSIVLTSYAACGKPYQKSAPFFSKNLINPQPGCFIAHSYDPLGRPLSSMHPTGVDGQENIKTTWKYAKGEQVMQTHAAGSPAEYIQILKHHSYDGHVKVIRNTIQSDNNAITEYTYDPLGQLLTAKDPIGVINTIVYDSLKRKISQDNPDQNTTGNNAIKALTYAYDNTTGKLKSKTDAAHNVIRYSYDNLGRKKSMTFSDGRAVNYIYDQAKNGNKHLSSIAIKSADGNTESLREFAYDYFGNKNLETVKIVGETDVFTTKSTFDPQNRMINQVFPDHSTCARKYQDGLLVSQSMDGTKVDYPFEEYTASGHFQKLIYGEGTLPGAGIQANFNYNPFGQLYGESLNADSNKILQLSYTYDQLNQILGISDAVNNEAQTFTYLNKRLATAQVPGFKNSGSYRYDGAGNILHKDGGSYSNKAHFPTSIKSGDQEVYAATQDACGRTSSRRLNGKTLNFTYDGLGCIKTIVDANNAPLRQIIADDKGHRLKEIQADGTTLLFINSSFRLKRKAQATKITKYLNDHIGSLASIENNLDGSAKQIRYYRRDHSGSNTHVFDQNGAVLKIIAYDGYGFSKLIQGQHNEEPRYEHRSWDNEIGLYYFDARYYDPRVGRFLTPDTQLGSKKHLQADVWNRFAFELNNPINHIDPDGHSSAAAWITGFTVGVIATAAAIAIGIGTAGVGAPAAIAADAEIEADVVASTTAAEVAGNMLQGAAIGALGGAGGAASFYSAGHQKNFSFKGFAAQVAIGAAFGAAMGGVAPGIGQLTSKTLGRMALNALSGAVFAVSNSAASNAAIGNKQSGAALGFAALAGVVSGGLMSLGMGKSLKMASELQPEMEEQSLLSETIESDNYRTFEDTSTLSESSSSSNSTDSNLSNKANNQEVIKPQITNRHIAVHHFNRII